MPLLGLYAVHHCGVMLCSYFISYTDCLYIIVLNSFKTLHHLAPDYIIDMLHGKDNSSYSLRSNNRLLLNHPKEKMNKSTGDKSFLQAAPTLWNKLPSNIQIIQSLSVFKKELKTFLFKQAFG